MTVAPLAVLPGAERPVFRQVFTPGKLTLGLVLPPTDRREEDPDPLRQIEYAALADRLGFRAVWVRDVPLNSPDYPDPLGHLDPWVFLAAIAGRTERIALGTGAVVTPLRHPLHVAKAALSIDLLSRGRMLLGLGSGDRPPEFAAFGHEHGQRAEAFRVSWDRIAAALDVPSRVLPDLAMPDAPAFELRPRATHGPLPILAIGSAQQTLGWIARHAAAWVTYYRAYEVQKDRYALWRAAVDRLPSGPFRGFAQSFHLELLDDRSAPTEALPLGARLGSVALVDELRRWRHLGVHHVMFNLNATGRPIADILQELARDVLPYVDA